MCYNFENEISNFVLCHNHVIASLNLYSFKLRVVNKIIHNCVNFALIYILYENVVLQLY